MENNTKNSRVRQKNDIEANWKLAVNFIPLDGELIVYDVDENYSYPRFKVGNGTDYVEDLPFTNKPSDWNQSDETAPDYIKNRTHYETVEQAEIVLNNVTFIEEPHPEYGSVGEFVYSVPPELNLSSIIKENTRVVIDGFFENPTEGSFVDYDDYLCAILPPYEYDPDQPPSLTFYKNENNLKFIFRYAAGETSQLNVEKISFYGDAIVVKQLDEKYIPDTIAKVVDIKNGTYFTEAEKYDILVDTTTINVEAEDFYYRTTQSPFTAQIIDGNKYLVIFDEVSYICYGRKYNKMNDTLSNCFDYCLIGDVVFNNGNYSRPISGSNLPFCIVNDYFENTNDFTADVLVFGDTASTHTIKIVDVTPTVKKLPEEFLADNFKAVTKGFGEKSAIFGLGQEASGAMSIAAGQSTVASGWMSIALGLASKASGAAALTLGQLAEASGTLAVAHGFNTKASGAAAVAAGDGTIAGSECQLVHGKFNIEDTADTYAHIVGGGENNMNRKNIYALDWTGNASFAGEVSAASIKIGNTEFTETQLLKILNFIETVEIGNN